MKYFEVKLSYEGLNEEGKDVVVKERIVFKEAETFGSAEELAYKLAEERSLTEVYIDSIKTLKVSTVMDSEKEEEDNKWYLAQVKFLAVDEKSGKVKTAKENNLIKRETPEKVIEVIHEIYKDSMFGYDIVNVKESGINEVI